MSRLRLTPFALFILSLSLVATVSFTPDRAGEGALTPFAGPGVLLRAGASPRARDGKRFLSLDAPRPCP